MAKSRARSSFRRKLIAVAVSSCFIASTASANPTGPAVVNGTASIVQNGNLLQITNSPNAILNWQSFSIGANEITRFIQQSASSAVLNRVTTQNPSTILGALQSNGRVFIINPNGILFGAGAQVDVAGLVASTLNLSDTDFLAGRMRFTDGLGSGVVNQGNITTGAGGNVYLVGSAVTNSGIITSPQGEVILAAGNSVELVNPGTPNLRVEIAAADNEARNLGQIISDAGRIGIYAGLINNAGSIRADSVVSEGGRILLKATKNATLESSSVLSAQGQGGGEIKVLAGEQVQVAGRLDASAPNGGDGGFIETSASKVHVDSDTIVTTTAQHGKTGTWLIDPTDYLIQFSGGDITGTVLGRNLDSNNIVITSDQGTVQTAGNGDILVFDQITWTAPNSLTLLARRNVELNSSISGGGDLVFLAGWNGDLQSPVVTSGIGDITSSFNSVTTGGNVFFEAGRDIHLVSSVVGAGSSALSGNRIAQLVAGGSINLTNPDGNVGVVATAGLGGTGTVVLHAKTGSISLDGAIIQASSTSSDATLNMTAGGNIVLNTSTVNVAGGAGGSSGTPGGTASATLSAGGSIQLLTGSNILVAGGDGGRGFTNGGNGGAATVTLTASSISLANSSTISATGGAGAASGGSSSGAGRAGGNGGAAIVRLNGGAISVANSIINANGGSGGDGGSAFEGGTGGRGGNGGDATVALSGSSVSMTGSTIFVNGGRGGDGGSASSGAVGGLGGNGGSAAVTLTGGSISLATTNILSFGGSGGSGGDMTGSSAGNGGNGGNGGSASVTLSAGSITVNSASVIAGGGSGGFGGFGGGSSSGGTGVNGALGTGGAASVLVAASSGSLAVQGSSISADGAEGGSAAITLSALGNITLTGSFFNARGGGDTCCDSVGGNAGIGITAGGNLIVDGGQGLAFGGDGFTKGGDASIVLAANGNITLMNGVAIGAFGGDGGTGTGGAGVVALNPATGVVDLSNGSAVQAFGGSGTITSGSGLITMHFPGLTSGGWFIDGVESQITDGSLGGFFVSGAPAILDTNLIVTYGGTQDIPSELVTEMNRLSDVLADQLKAGEIGLTAQKDKLAVCD